jgi:hypothetical protein
MRAVLNTELGKSAVIYVFYIFFNLYVLGLMKICLSIDLFPITSVKADPTGSLCQTNSPVFCNIRKIGKRIKKFTR